MRQTSRYVAIALLTLGLGGCNFFGGGEPQPPEGTLEPVTPQTGEVPQPDSAAQPDQAAQSPEGEGFEEPVIEGEGTAVGSLPLDLIPSTDPNSRAAQVERERADPFDLLPTAPTVEIPAGAEVPPGPAEPTEPGELAPIPELVPQEPPVPIPPQPEIARAIAVTGVVQLGNVPYAIVNAPNEPHGRYVRVGQRLSNGEVLVKRIDMNYGGDPIVIFEQFGVEVATAVGSGGIPDDAETTAVAIANVTE